VGLLACGDAKKKELESLAEAGRFTDAATLAMATLDAEPEHKAARTVLDEVAAGSYAERLDSARELEASGKLEEALTRLLEAEALLATLAKYSVTGIDDDGLAEDLSRGRTAVARARFDQGEALLASAEFEAAIERYLAAEEVAAGQTDARRQHASALRAWAEHDVANKRYRDAITHYDALATLSGDALARAWSATIHAALGRHALHRGACRQAVIDLRAARALPYDPTLGTDLDEAMACSRTELVVRNFEEIAHDDLAGTALAPMLSDRINHQVRAKASEFLVLLDTDYPSKESRSFEVRGRLTQVQVDRPEPTAIQRTVTGRTMVKCVIAANEWEEGTATHCEDDVEVSYEEKAAHIQVTVTGSLRVINPTSGEQVMSTALEAKESHSARFAEGFSFVDTDGERKTTTVGTSAAIGVIAVPAELIALAEGPPPMPEEAAVARQAVETMAVQAVTAVLDAVDHPPASADPSHLTLKPPVMDASGITFGEKEADVERKIRVEVPAP
jgi:tetratricopeptide (TPR) repeat protein